MVQSRGALQGEAEGWARFLSLTIAVTLFALVLRVFYLSAAQVDVPIRGDVLGYWNYAWNLINHATFSSSPPDGPEITPDSFRGPGYPLFLAFCMAWAGTADRALDTALAAQLLVGSALVPLTITLARSWLERPAALVAGLIVALWPHLIVFSSTLLSETFFGFTLLSMAVLADAAQRRNSILMAALAGLMCGLAYLTNPVMLLFPVAIVCLIAQRRQFRVGLSLLLGFSLVVGTWGFRNASLPESAGAWQRASMNLVEGSWPLYHDASNAQSSNEMARAVANAIRDEERLMFNDPKAGWRSVWGRFGEDRPYYLSWYLLQKPYLLWDWRVRLGWGDVYFLETHNSPFERDPAFRAVHALFLWLNPFVFCFAAAGSLACLIRGIRRPDLPFAPLLVALFFIYITAIHVVFQAEPRYSVAYRPFEILLAVAMVAAAFAHAVDFTRRRNDG